LLEEIKPKKEYGRKAREERESGVGEERENI